jgi:hypothetical protein
VLRCCADLLLPRRAAVASDGEQLKMRVYAGGGDSDSFAIRMFTLLIIVLAVLYRFVFAN